MFIDIYLFIYIYGHKGEFLHSKASEGKRVLTTFGFSDMPVTKLGFLQRMDKISPLVFLRFNSQIDHERN